jgi:hypothetical protein
MGVSHLQMVGVLGIFKARGTEVFNEIASRPSEVIGGSLTSLLPIKCALNSQIYGPFLLNMASPPAALAVAALLMIPKTAVERRIRKRRTAANVPIFKGKFILPRWLAVHRLLRNPMTTADAVEWLGEFRPKERLMGVVIFLLFFLCVECYRKSCRAHPFCGAFARVFSLSLTLPPPPPSRIALPIMVPHNLLQLPHPRQVDRIDLQLLAAHRREASTPRRPHRCLL